MNRKKGFVIKGRGKEIRNIKKKICKLEENEDVTKYGEFVSSYFAWLSLDKQKKKADEMQNMTNKKNE